MKRLLIFLLSGCLLLLAACDAAKTPPGDGSSSQPGPPSSQGQSQEDPPNEDVPLPTCPVSAQAFIDQVGQPAWDGLVEYLGVTPNVFLRRDQDRWLFYYQEFEEPTTLWGYDPSQGEPILELLPQAKLPGNTSIKKVVLVPDSDEALLILGHRYGTVSPGGDLYRLDLTSKVLSPFYATGKPEVQVVDAVPMGDSLLLEVQTFDSNMEHPQTTKKTLPLYVESGALAAVFDQPAPAGAVGGARQPLPDGHPFKPVQVLRLDQSGESVLILPRYTGSTVRVYQVKLVGNTFVNTGWLAAYYNTPDGWALDLQTMLPEGAPTVKVVISNFGKTGEFLAGYDGKGESDMRWIAVQ